MKNKKYINQDHGKENCRLAVAALCCAAMMMTACGGSQGSTPTAAAGGSTQETSAAGAAQSTSVAGATEDAELTELDVVLDWYPNAVHTFLYEAEQNGYFAEEGLKVNIISPAESIDALTFVAAGRAQIGFSYPVDTVTANANEHMPVVAIGAVVQDELSCMASLAETDITADMSSLRGKKVGHSGPAVEEAVLRTIIANAGLGEQDVEMLNVGFDLTTSLTTRSTDLVVGTFINDEIVTMRNMGYDVNVWKYQDYGVPPMYGLVMLANKEAYAAAPEVYEGFLRACAKGFDDMQADEEQAMALIMSAMASDDNPLDEAQQRESYEILMPLMEQDGKPFLSMSESMWQDTIDWMLESGLIEDGIDASEVYLNPTLG